MSRATFEGSGRYERALSRYWIVVSKPFG